MEVFYDMNDYFTEFMEWSKTTKFVLHCISNVWLKSCLYPLEKCFDFLIISKTLAFPKLTNTNEAVALVILEPENLGP